VGETPKRWPLSRVTNYHHALSVLVEVLYFLLSRSMTACWPRLWVHFPELAVVGLAVRVVLSNFSSTTCAIVRAILLCRVALVGRKAMI